MNRYIKRIFAIALSIAVAVTAVFGAQGQGKGKFRRATKAVVGEYIVVLKDAVGAQNVSTVADALSRKHGGVTKHKFSKAISGFSVKLTEAQALALSQDPSVDFIEENGMVHTVDVQYNPVWGLDRIDQNYLPLSSSYDNHSLTGVGTTVYVIDTGIRVTHQEFGGRAYVGADFIGDGLNGNDGKGHGTHVAATIGGTTYGVAKQVSLCAVRVLDSTGNGSWEQVIAGVDWVTANHSGSAVANMSLGGGASDSLDLAVRNSIASGVTYVVAAGNWSIDAAVVSPARVTEAITVGASDASDTIADFSDYGTVVDLFAPGVDITSAWNSSDSATNTISGTSMATPHVAGLAAIYLQKYPGKTPDEVQNALKNKATSGVVIGVPSGTTDRLALIEDGGPVQPPTCDSITNSGSPTSAASFEVYANNVHNASRVLFPTWTEVNGQDELIWYEGVYEAANNRWKCVVNVSEHNYESGLYITHVYAVGADNQSYFMGATYVTQVFSPPSADSVTNSGSPCYNTSFDVYANNVRNAVRVVFPTWTDANGQDEIVWYEGTFDPANNRWKRTVNISEHNNELGAYTTHAYALGTNNQWYILGGTNVTVYSDRVYINGWNLPGHPIAGQGYSLSWSGYVSGVNYVILYCRPQGSSQWRGCGSGGGPATGGYITATGGFGFTPAGVWEFGVGYGGSYPTSISASITVY